MSKVLIIEDDAAVRESIKEALELKNYEMIIAANGLEALEVCKDKLPDIVISDIMMPYMNGYEILHAFQNNPRTSSIPFIFLSAKSGNSDIREAMNGGADDYITKPFKVKDLLETVEMRLRKRRKFDDTIKHITTSISQYVPHELRTPLVAIMGYSDILLSDYERINKKELLEMLKGIKLSGNKLYKTIEKFLLLSELSFLPDENSNNNLKLSECTLLSAGYVQNCLLSLLKDFQRTPDVEYEIEEASVALNQNHLRKILEEIVENALKFSDEGSAVQIKGYIKDHNYTIEVIDHGFGFTAEQLEMTMPLIQHNREEQGQNGIGLGLAIVKRLMHLYKGRLDIKCEKGTFTSVIIVLPLAYN
ncbi:MAG: response regulator [Ignavibacteriaceae bacterium]